MLVLCFILLQRKYLSLSSASGQGCSVTTYGLSIASLKKTLRQAVNDLADNLDEETREVRGQVIGILLLNGVTFLGNSHGECQSV